MMSRGGVVRVQNAPFVQVGVDVEPAGMLVRVEVQGPPLPQSQEDAEAERDQHQADAELEDERYRRGKFDVEQNNDAAEPHQGGGVAHPPVRADERRLPAVPLVRNQGRHRGEVVDVERMLHPEEEAEDDNRKTGLFHAWMLEMRCGRVQYRQFFSIFTPP
ncbi:MAG TPA: hypothetical protein VI932_07900 [Bacteroidota bacterium]|nr:hypothetical protein [Bacteroidota bacterium]